MAAQEGLLGAAVVNAFAGRYGEHARQRLQDWERLVLANRDAAVNDKLVHVNGFFNQVPWLSDHEHWGRRDYWATPLEMLGTNDGDCEDFCKDGNVNIHRTRALGSLDVPDWFVSRLPVHAPQASAELTSGWTRSGSVIVRSYPGYVYEERWHSTLTSMQSALVFLAFALVFITLLLRWMLRPLDIIERQARAVAGREFPRIEQLPRTREFRRVAEAMNLMTGSVEKVIAELR